MSSIPFNWINWQQVLLDDRRLSFYAKGLGMFLNTYMNNSNDMAYPSVATICGRMNCTDKTVTKYTNELVSFGYLQKVKRFGQSVKYIATSPSIVQDTKLAVSDEVRSSIVRDTISVSDEIRSNNQENNQLNSQERKCSRENVRSIAFIAFWEAYPKKVDKKKAETAFNRLSIAKQEKAIADIRSGRFSETPKRYIPNPTTYIHGERWEDDACSTNQPGFLYK